jgi:hypothetical protein
MDILQDDNGLKGKFYILVSREALTDEMLHTLKIAR